MRNYYFCFNSTSGKFVDADFELYFHISASLTHSPQPGMTQMLEYSISYQPTKSFKHLIKDIEIVYYT
jgi:hypothetical protein